MHIGLMLGVGKARPSAPAVFDPEAQSASGLWLPPYGGVPWLGTDSAGSSGTRDLTSTAGLIPGVGSINGLAVPDLDGSNDNLSLLAGGTLSDFVLANAGSLWAVFDADAAMATTGQPYDAPAFFSVTNLRLSFAFDSGGVWAHIFTGAGGHKSKQIACATGGPHYARMRFNGTVLELSVDGGPFQSVAAGSIDDRTGNIWIGTNGTAANYFNGRIGEIGVVPEYLSDEDFDMESYVLAKYNL
jgi:hypothetical protein